MRIALMHPTYWPEVRRGSERLIHDLGAGLAARGHDVTLITSHPGSTSVASEDGFEVIRNRRLPLLRPLRWYEDHIINAPAAGYRLWRGDFDVAHAFFPADAWAASHVRKRLGGPPFVFTIHGIPVREYLVARRYRLEMQLALAQDAAATTVLSDAAAEAVRRYLLVDPTVVSGGVVCSDFEVERPPEPAREGPVIACAASLRDPRKRADVLLEAFGKLRARFPDAELHLVRPRDPLILQEQAQERPEGVHWIEASETRELARLYAEADISVLASVGEAFGLVLVESLAAGTPVVAARSGACPEIVTDDAIGRLFEPDDPDDLVRAMVEAIALRDRAGTAEACRARARDFDISRALDSFEAIYADAVGAGRAA
jgi:glycosyltransferase involved in cell wall biosynthesis